MDRAAARQPLADSLSAMALSRLTSLTLWGHAADPTLLINKVRADTALTHPAPAASDAAAVLAFALQSLLNGKSASESREAAHAFARRSGCAPEVIEAVAGSHEPASAPKVAVDAPDVATAVHATLFHLTKTASFEDAVAQAIAASPVSDILPALVGAFMGARFGRDGIPERTRNTVLSCRPMDGLTTSSRPATYWATDAMTIAEALLTAR
jgi:ADP-ribosylglycohydrolase